MLKDVSGIWNEVTTRTLPRGTYIVRAGQPYGLLAFYLLEPESEDGLAQWSFFDGVLQSHEAFPVTRITKPMTLPFRSHVVRD